VAADRPARDFADFQRKQRMVSDQNTHRLARCARKGLADEFDLIGVDAAVLEGQRARGVDAEHRNSRQLDEWAQGLVDEAAVARERRQEAAEHVIQRHVVIAGHSDHIVAALAQAVEELASLAELLGPGALGEVAADDDKVGLELVGLAADGPDEALVMRSEVEVGQVEQASHSPVNALPG